MASDLHEVAAQRLRAVGQRYTSGRRKVVDVLAQSGQPLTIPELLAAGDRVPQSSAYRNLAVLEQAGVVHRLVTSGDFARFELAEDLTEHHHHLICAACGGVEDFIAPPSLERSLHRAVTAVEDSTGFSASLHRLDLIGTCRACA
ncbi:MAG TPA: Fur family transcriptional regulator [Acidimicrobiales bacterium]|nr:Fur family transcriptional regulator [Acidimicrobiales bacterium]